MKKIILLSGGMDSATALAMEIRHGFQIETLSFNYGSKHNDMEYSYAKKLCEHYGVQSTRIDLDFVNKFFSSDLLKSGGDIPDGHYADLSMKRTVVPFRNGIMISIAIGYAESVGAGVVVLANHAGDHHIYPDCRTDFVDAMNTAAKHGTYAGIRLQSPFNNRTKTFIASAGDDFDVPWKLTYSCYKGGPVHCGTCGTCTERKEAFRDSKVKDPTEYLA